MAGCDKSAVGEVVVTPTKDSSASTIGVWSSWGSLLDAVPNDQNSNQS